MPGPAQIVRDQLDDSDDPHQTAEAIPGRLRGPLRRREVSAIASDVAFAVSIESGWVDHVAANREIARKNSGSSFTSRNPASA
jgi:hypothetical protein